MKAVLLLMVVALASSAAADRLGDYDGDGRADVLLRHTDRSWRYYAMDGLAVVGEPARVSMTPKPEWHWAGAGDFNGDGRDDVLLRRADGPWVYYPLDGHRVLVEERGWANLTRNLDWRVAGVGDFNGDGRDDMLLRRMDGVWVYYPMNGRRVVAEERGWANLPRDTGWRMAGIGDFNGDRRDDVLLRHEDGAWRYYPMNGRRVVADQRGTPQLTDSLAWQAVGIGDFNGDGQDDVLLRHSGGGWRVQAMADGKVLTVGSGPVDLPGDWAWRMAGVGDVDGDGRDDVLLRHVDGRWRASGLVGSDATAGVVLDLPLGDGWRVPHPPVYIPDAGLRTGVLDALGKAAGEVITRRHLSMATVVNASESGVEDLTGVGWATGLTTLRLAGNRIDDLSPLAGLIGISELQLDRNEISDVSTLAGLRGLRHLFLGDNAIGDLSPLGELVELEWVRLNSNRIADMSPLAAWTRLRSIRLDGNEIADISGLAELRELESLYLEGNAIADLSPIVGHAQLTHLGLSENAITDLSPLASLPALRWLTLDNNRVEDLSPLAGLRHLSQLRLDGNAIAELSPLGSLHGLERLHLVSNRIEDVSALETLTALRRLELSFNAIADASSLAGLVHLGDLRLGGNRIREVSALAGMRELYFLSLHGNEIDDLSPLAGLTGLQWLYLVGNDIVDLSPLAGLTALKWLSLGNNAIVDVSPLAGLTGLEKLWLTGNRIEDISSLAGLTALDLLDLNGNHVTDVSAVETLTSLRVLRLAYNRITDLSPLLKNAGLSDGDMVDVRGNPLTDESTDTVIAALVGRGVGVEVDSRPRFEGVHNDNVVVFRVEESIATDTVYDGLELRAYALTFYAHFADEFDFLMFFSNLDDIADHEDAPYFGVYSAVSNDVDGIGRARFYDSRYGSAERLKGAIHFPYNRALLYGPSPHELQHAWSNYAVPTAVGGHWGFSSADGQLGGFDFADLAELGNGRYAAGWFGTIANGGNGPAYSLIELYFAGYVAPEEVPDLWVAEDGAWLVEDGDVVRTDDGQAIFAASDVRTYSMDDIVAENGNRVPAMSEAQWHFRVAAILLTDDDHPATTAQLDLLSEHAASFTERGSDGRDRLHNYYEATAGRGSVTMDGLSALRRSVAGAIPTDLPASFGIVPVPYASTRDGRCLPIDRLAVARNAGGKTRLGWPGRSAGRDQRR